MVMFAHGARWLCVSVLVAACSSDVGEANTGGTFSVKASGAVTATAESNDASFCDKTMTVAGQTMRSFALSLVDSKYAVSMSNGAGTPGVGEETIGREGMGATFIDKTSGSDYARWQHYAASKGTLKVTSASADVVEGSYEFSAVPKMPATNGAPVQASGAFKATKARVGC